VEYLVTADPDGSGKPYPMLATSWQFSSDNKSLTFNLRKNVKFHDGTDFNAQAAKFCLDLMRSGPRIELKRVSSIDIVDEYTIKLNLSSYTPTLINGFIGYPTMIVSPTNYQKVGADVAAFAPVGTGPFQFVSYTPQISLKLKRFDGYWGPKAYLDGLEWVCIADAMTTLAALKAGEVDAARSINLNDFADLAKSSDYVPNTFTALCNGMAGDSANPTSPFSDIKVRQAIAYAIDTPTIAKNVGFGYYEVGKELVPSTHWAYDPTTVGYPYNPQKAKALLAETGFAKGFDTSIVYNVSNPRTQAYTMIQAYLKELNINLELKPGPNVDPTLANGWNNHLVYYQFGCAPDREPGQELLASFSSKATYITPKSLYIPPDYDSTLLAVLNENDVNKYRATIKGLMKDMIDKYCMLFPVFFTSAIMISHNYVHDMNFQKYANAQWDPNLVWMSKH
jgi:peptide/nickel transport system substrate-binding protein